MVIMAYFEALANLCTWPLPESRPTENVNLFIPLQQCYGFKIKLTWFHEELCLQVPEER